MSNGAVPAWVRFTSNSFELPWAFERAYELGKMPHAPGSERSGRRVEALLRDRYPDLTITVDPDSGLTVIEATSLAGAAHAPVVP